ncbi:hypothetical protein [Hyphomicrobium sp.]|nr:hypothetical protein [Hyphomicrobium sp.]
MDDLPLHIHGLKHSDIEKSLGRMAGQVDVIVRRQAVLAVAG